MTEKNPDAELLAQCSDDASKWAAHFRKTAIDLGYSDMPEDWLGVWFSNAIEHSHEVRKDRRERRAEHD